MAAQPSPPTPSGRPNLRHHHRIPVNLDASLEQDGRPVPACTINNLSRSGLQIACTPEALNQLVPDGEPVAPQMAVPVHIAFEVPVGESGSTRIQARCDVVTVRRIARDCFHVGMSFTEFKDKTDSLLNHYINEQLAAGA